MEANDAAPPKADDDEPKDADASDAASDPQRIEEPEDVALVVKFLASEGARFMTGQGINVTGGVRMD